MKLIIVESPNKVKKIEQFFIDAGEKDIKVAASFGHVADLPERDLGLDQQLRPQYLLTSGGKKTVAYLRKLVKYADEVYLATDPDREGEAIAFHLQRELKIRSPRRISFKEITPKAVLDAYRRPRELDKALYEAQETRRVLDRLVGYLVSPELSRRAGKALSAGRVQSPAVKIVAYRQAEIANFQSRNFYELGFKLPGEEIVAWADLSQYLADGDKHLYNERMAQQLASQVGALHVESVEEEMQTAAAPKPLITSSLQVLAQQRLGFSPALTMQYAQQLFESGLITYMRTDSASFSEDGFQDLVEVLQSQGIAPRDKAPQGKGAASAQEAHEAIRPTHAATETAEGGSPGAQRLYQLVRQQSLLAAMPDAVDAVLKVQLLGDDPKLPFVATAKSEKSAGFRALSRTWKEENTEGKPDIRFNRIPDVGTHFEGTAFVEPKRTKAPKRYTEATLIRAMEALGIGRPSTYASILENIRKRGYIEEQKKQLWVTDLGMALVAALDPLPFMNLNYTAIVEKTLDSIACGKAFYAPTVAAIKSDIEEQIGLIKMAPQVETAECPGCEQQLKRLYSSSKDFYFWVHMREEDADNCIRYIQDCDGQPVITFSETSEPAA